VGTSGAPPEPCAEVHRDAMAGMPGGTLRPPAGMYHAVTALHIGDLGRCRCPWGGEARRRESGGRRPAPSAAAATRPGSPLYLRNYMSVIRPRLWKTLWITRGAEWRNALSGAMQGAMHQLCTGEGGMPSRSGPSC